jgi:hypothetical protein
MRGASQAARKQIVLALERRASNPHQDRLAGRFGDFELDRPLSFLLHDDGAGGDAITVGNIPNPQLHQIAAAQFAVDRQVEQGEFALALTEFEGTGMALSREI